MRPLVIPLVALMTCAIVGGISYLAHGAEPAPPTTQPSSAKLRVGVYDSRAVCVAARNSGVIQKRIEGLQKQLKDAEAKGDKERAEQIKARGQNMQTVAHLQAFSNAPVDEFLAVIKDKLPTIAADAGVDVIAVKADFTAPGVETVDVTDALVKAFSPDERTLKTVQELRKAKPYPMVDVLGMKD